jgi:Domain of unknown function (DUF4124)
MDKKLTRKALFLGICLMLAHGLASAQTIKKCVDEKGVTHYGDPLPPQCAKSEVKEISTQGTVKKTMDRPLTPEEIKAREEEVERSKDARRKEEDQLRRDRALLATYGSEKEFDVSRDKAMDVVKTRQKTSENRLKELADQKKKLEAEMEFYNSGKSKTGKGKDAPSTLTQAIARNNKDIETVKDSIAKMEDEKKNIASTFEADKQRWKDLKSGKAVLRLQDQVIKNATRKAGELGKVVCNNVEFQCYAGQIYYCREVTPDGKLKTRYIDCN